MRLCAFPLSGLRVAPGFGVLARMLAGGLLGVLVLGILASARAQLAPLPATARFDQEVSFRTGAEGETLEAMIQVLARSVGLTAVTQGVPEAVIRYDIGQTKPFREVWEIVLTLNGLEYVLRDSDIVIVGTPETLSGLRGTQVAEGEPREVRTYTLNNSPEQFQELIASQFAPGSGAEVIAFEELGLLSVRGTADQQTRVGELLARFDRRAAVPVRRAYALSHARAEDLAEVLTETITAPSDGSITATTPVIQPAPSAESGTPADTAPTTAAASPDAAATVIEGQATIAADVRTNRLIVTAPEAVQEDIAALIGELDQPERQVNIQVRIQEVTTDMAERLGVDLSAGIDRFAATLFGGGTTTSGLSFVFDAQRAITGFNLGAILDVFESQGLSRRVDDSNLTVLNNGTATLQSGGTIFISIAGGAENIERTIPYGVQLDLTPQITNSDEVILDVNGRVEAILSETNDPEFLELSTRGITSRVTLAPGQTVVLGGLLQNQVIDASRSVPGLSSVPIIGGLFSSSSATESTTELLVIVTASVLE